MTIRRFRPVLLVLSAALLVTAVPAAPAAAADLTPAQGEARVLSLINQDRASAGLRPVRLDTRLTAIARARSADMVKYDYFAHQQPDGRNVFDYIAAARITWYGAGEILAKNNYPTIDSSASAANGGWLDSAGHRAIIMSNNYNYVGVGLGIDSKGDKYWTAVFLKGPDRTPARARMRTPARGTATSTTVRYTVRWSGSDTPLVVLTSGLKNFQVQRKVGSGRWVYVTTTAYKSRTFSLYRRRTYQFRVRPIDRAGNVGTWTSPITIKT